jgi:hypothetical protein
VAAFLSPPEQLNLGPLYASLRHVKTRMQNPAPPGPADSTPGKVSESASPTRSEVDKSRCFVSASCLVADVTALASSLVPPFVCWLTRSSDRPRSGVTARPPGAPEPRQNRPHRGFRNPAAQRRYSTKARQPVEATEQRRSAGRAQRPRPAARTGRLEEREQERSRSPSSRFPCGAEQRKRSEARTARGRKRAPCHGGPTRPTIDRREIGAPTASPTASAPTRGRSRCGLHLTFVRTTQERRKPGSSWFPVAPDVVARWSL